MEYINKQMGVRIMKIISWKLVVFTESGDEHGIDVTDIPDDVAIVIDDFISDDLGGDTNDY